MVPARGFKGATVSAASHNCSGDKACRQVFQAEKWNEDKSVADMKMQPSLERALRHKEILKA